MSINLEKIINNINGWGIMSKNQEIDYLGIRVYMKPSVFLSLAEHLDRSRAPSVEKIKEHLENGGTIASPTLQIDTPKEWLKQDFKKVAKIIYHEGRNRMYSIMELYGDVPIEVHLVFINGIRASNLTSEYIDSLSTRLRAERTNKLIKGNLFYPKNYKEKSISSSPKRIDATEIPIKRTKTTKSQNKTQITKPIEPTITFSSFEDIFTDEFQDGGYTDKGNPNEIAGIVHKDEYVINSEDLNEIKKQYKTLKNANQQLKTSHKTWDSLINAINQNNQLSKKEEIVSNIVTNKELAQWDKDLQKDAKIKKTIAPLIEKLNKNNFEAKKETIKQKKEREQREREEYILNYDKSQLESLKSPLTEEKIPSKTSAKPKFSTVSKKKSNIETDLQEIEDKLKSVEKKVGNTDEQINKEIKDIVNPVSEIVGNIAEIVEETQNKKRGRPRKEKEVVNPTNKVKFFLSDLPQAEDIEKEANTEEIETFPNPTLKSNIENVEPKQNIEQKLAIPNFKEKFKPQPTRSKQIYRKKGNGEIYNLSRFSKPTFNIPLESSIVPYKSASRKKEENPFTTQGMRKYLIGRGVKGAARFNKKTAVEKIQSLQKLDKLIKISEEYEKRTPTRSPQRYNRGRVRNGSNIPFVYPKVKVIGGRKYRNRGGGLVPYNEFDYNNTDAIIDAQFEDNNVQPKKNIYDYYDEDGFTLPNRRIEEVDTGVYSKINVKSGKNKRFVYPKVKAKVSRNPRKRGGGFAIYDRYDFNNKRQKNKLARYNPFDYNNNRPIDVEFEGNKAKRKKNIYNYYNEEDGTFDLPKNRYKVVESDIKKKQKQNDYLKNKARSILDFFLQLVKDFILYKILKWIGDPKNADKVKNLVEFVKKVIGFVDFVAGGLLKVLDVAAKLANILFGGIEYILDTVKLTLQNIPIIGDNFGGNELQQKASQPTPQQNNNVNVNPIPKLAKGGLVENPTLATVGEAGKEAIIPLEKLDIFSNVKKKKNKPEKVQKDLTEIMSFPTKIVGASLVGRVSDTVDSSVIANPAIKNIASSFGLPTNILSSTINQRSKTQYKATNAKFNNNDFNNFSINQKPVQEKNIFDNIKSTVGNAFKFIQDKFSGNNNISGNMSASPNTDIFSRNNNSQSYNKNPEIIPQSGKRLFDAPLTSYYGYRIHPITGNRRFHAGVDFGMEIGTKLPSKIDGVVTHAGWQGGYGNVVDIRSDDGVEIKYAHLSKPMVKVGQRVKAGEVIGLSGNTGNSTGPHLHFEVRKNGKLQDPLKFNFSKYQNKIIPTNNQANKRKMLTTFIKDSATSELEFKLSANSLISMNAEPATIINNSNEETDSFVTSADTETEFNPLLRTLSPAFA